MRSWMLEALCLVTGVGLIVAVCIRLSHGRIFWEDEVLGWTVIHDPSWRHMLHAWNVGADSGGVLFYVSARGWFRLFGASATSFRLYSAAGFAAAFVCLWAALGTYYSRPTRLVSIAGVWFIGASVVPHICEGRFYGLFLFGAMLTFWSTLQGAAKQGIPSVWWFLFSFAANAVLITGHFLGIVYSLAVLSGLIVVDRLRKRPRPLLYLPSLLACCLIVPERTAIRSAMNVASPHSWITPPSVHNLLGAYHAFDARTDQLLFLLFIALVVVGSPHWRTLKRHMQARFLQNSELYLISSAVALIPIAFFIESRLAVPVFLDRYLLPVIIVPIILAAEGLRLLGVALSLYAFHRLRVPALQAWACAVFMVGLALWSFKNGPLHLAQRTDYTQTLVDNLPRDSTVVLPSSLAYAEVIARQYNSPVHFVYLLDWQRSISPIAPRPDVSSFHLISSWRRVGYYAQSIQDSAAFLQTHARFFVVETRMPYEDPDPNATGTVLASIARQPDVIIRPYPSIALEGVEDKVWLVCKASCSPPQ